MHGQSSNDTPYLYANVLEVDDVILERYYHERPLWAVLLKTENWEGGVVARPLKNLLMFHLDVMEDDRAPRLIEQAVLIQGNLSVKVPWSTAQVWAMHKSNTGSTKTHMIVREVSMRHAAGMILGFKNSSVSQGVGLEMGCAEGQPRGLGSKVAREWSFLSGDMQLDTPFWQST
jgi:hypothetical protein